jgi:hypothetical protein
VQADGYYAAIEGGGRFLEHASVRETGAGAPLPAARLEGEFDAGSAVGVTFGKYLQQNLRTEVEMQWSSNALDHLGVRRDGGLGETLNTPALTGQRVRTGGDLEAIAFMVNAFYEVDYGLLRPYFGAGVGLAAGAPNRRRECGPKGAALASCTRVSGPAAAPRSSAGCNLVAVARLALLAQGALLGSSGPRPRDHALLHERRVQFLEFVIIEHVVAVGVKVCHHLI